MHIKTFFHRISLPSKGDYSSKKVQNLNFVELTIVIRFLYEGTTEFLSDPLFPPTDSQATLKGDDFWKQK